ncbi:MAG: sugar phosphate isomerase/epimerase [Phycisphaerales bacterium]|jgi:sugar phosphate isomerase/epimerase
MKVAFSTIACPEWTLPRTIELAARLGYSGLELRTFGTGATELPGDPMLTAPGKVRRLCADAGIEPLSLASSISYDEPIFPPVVGRLRGDLEKSVAQTKSHVEFATKAGIGFVRVFGFETQPNEPMNHALRRILERLDLAVRTARHTGVRLVMESGGSFTKAEHLLRLVESASSADLVAAYSVANAWGSGENPVEGIATLGNELAVVKLSDLRNGTPKPLGEGDVPVAQTVRALAARGFDGTLVYELPRLWMHREIEPEAMIQTAIERIYIWWGEGQPSKAEYSTAAAV